MNLKRYPKEKLEKIVNEAKSRLNINDNVEIVEIEPDFVYHFPDEMYSRVVNGKFQILVPPFSQDVNEEQIYYLLLHELLHLLDYRDGLYTGEHIVWYPKPDYVDDKVWKHLHYVVNEFYTHYFVGKRVLKLLDKYELSKYVNYLIIPKEFVEVWLDFKYEVFMYGTDFIIEVIRNSSPFMLYHFTIQSLLSCYELFTVNYYHVVDYVFNDSFVKLAKKIYEVVDKLANYNTNFYNKLYTLSFIAFTLSIICIPHLWQDKLHKVVTNNTLNMLLSKYLSEKLEVNKIVEIDGKYVDMNEKITLKLVHEVVIDWFNFLKSIPYELCEIVKYFYVLP